MRTVKVVILHWTFVMLKAVLMDIFSVTEEKFAFHVLLDVKDAELQIFQHVLDVTADITVRLLKERTLV